MTKLTKYEKETIINFNQEETMASIYTCDESIIRQLDKLVKKDPRITLDAKDEHSKTYIVSKKAIKIRLPRILSEKKHKELSLRAKKNFKHQ